MATSTATSDLQKKHCVPCEGGIAPLARDKVADLLKSVPRWKVASDQKSIRREWNAEDFSAALDFLNRVGEIAENEGHHPDLHLTGYRNVAIELSTHAVRSLTENDFILAAKIDALPLALKSRKPSLPFGGRKVGKKADLIRHGSRGAAHTRAR